MNCLNAQEELYGRVAKHSPPNSKVPLESLVPMSPPRLEALDHTPSLGEADLRETEREFGNLGRGSPEHSGPSSIE